MNEENNEKEDSLIEMWKLKNTKEKTLLVLIFVNFGITLCLCAFLCFILFTDLKMHTFEITLVHKG